MNKHDTSRKYIEQTCRPELFAAMDEYAKQQAIAFSEWCQENGWDKHVRESSWYNRMGYATEYTTDQLFTLFLNVLNKQP